MKTSYQEAVEFDRPPPRHRIEHFLKRGEDADLILAGDHIYDHIYKSPPRLWELGMAATDTKTKLRQQWETDKVAS